MTRTLIAAALVTALAAPAFASNSLAASLGVEPGVYTTSQLVQLKAAKADDDHVRIRQIMAEVEAGGFDGASDFSQVASSIDAEGLSGSDIVALKAAIDEDDADRIFALRGNVDVASETTFSTRGGPVSEQLSASVGVAPGALSTAELVQLKAAQAEDDHDTIFRILSSVN
ncbi:MAG: hypothetical protein AAGB05_03090 [Pseudomonadota bacterium]